MIEQIEIAAQGSYSADGAKLSPLKQINFIFGTNGVGKTTISRVIADIAAYRHCSLKWKHQKPLACFVYNSDFVAKNFTPQMRGIFTLGENSIDILEKIRDIKCRIDDIEDTIANRNEALGPEGGSTGKRAEKRNLRANFEACCWRIKKKHDFYFKNAFTGVRNSAAKFCNKILAEKATNTSKLLEIEELKRQATILFGEGLEQQPSITTLDMTDLIAVEADTVLAKKVVGKEDVDVAALIRRLGNSDWVRQGLPYLKQDEHCPFCQQEISTALAARINDYFDETYLNDIAAISKLSENYEILSNTIIRRCEEILASGSQHIDTEAFQRDCDQLSNRMATNMRLLENKKREPSVPVTLEPLEDLAQRVVARIKAANLAIAEHNRLVENIITQRRIHAAQVWKFLLHENDDAIQTYMKTVDPLDKAISGLLRGIEAKQTELRLAQAELRELEKNITSVQPTVTAINDLLASFGFSGFSLRTAGDRNHLYEIVREDGRCANTTLSEGEKSFVSFLYFYHLIRGSISEVDVTTDRIVVFDDPVSSLDSDVLFIVSTLIKRVIQEVLIGSGQIKQVFMLTHNIYFHKEVSYNSKRNPEAQALSHETFWIVRKVGGISNTFDYPHNPIKTSYELLWSEVRNPNRSNVMIHNTLRRIVENYFRILGNVDTDKIIQKFDGKDQMLCASLFSWVNDGSHSIYDDIGMSSDESIVARYLDVFRKIFEVTEHISHYQMMMGTS